MAGGGPQTPQNRNRNISPADDSVLDELDRMSNDGGVAPLLPHQQALADAVAEDKKSAEETQSD